MSTKLSHRLLKDAIYNLMNTGSCDIDWAQNYSEPGYSAPELGILFANWNEKSVYDKVTDKISHSPSICSRIANLIERSGLPYAMEWSDEWITCNDCGNAVRTEPDSYSWTQDFLLIDECEVICRNCLDDDTIEEYLVNNADRADVFHVDWSGRGWTEIDEDYASGWYGRDDRPSDAAAKCPEDHDFLFQITGVGQFETRWVMWVRPREEND